MKNDDDDNDYENDNMKKIKLIKTNSGAWKLVKTLGNWRQGNKTLKKNDKLYVFMYQIKLLYCV